MLLISNNIVRLFIRISRKWILSHLTHPIVGFTTHPGLIIPGIFAYINYQTPKDNTYEKA